MLYNAMHLKSSSGWHILGEEKISQWNTNARIATSYAECLRVDILYMSHMCSMHLHYMDIPPALNNRTTHTVKLCKAHS